MEAVSGEQPPFYCSQTQSNSRIRQMPYSLLFMVHVVLVYHSKYSKTKDMKTKITIITIFLSLITLFSFGQWQQVGYMVVNSNDTVNAANMIRGIGTDVYGCTSKGIFQSSDNGMSWTNISYNTPVIQNEIINCIFSSLNGDMFAGSTRRLYKSFDNGVTWIWLNTLPDSLDFSDVNEMNGNIIASYKIGFSTGGAYYSGDAGLTWTASTGLTNTPKWRLLADGNRVFLGSSGGVYESIDNGQSWNIAGTGFSGGGFRDVVKSGNAFFSGDISGGGLYATYDNAVSWSNADTIAFDPFCQVFSVTEASNMILTAIDGVCNPSGTSPIKMSSDTGHSWVPFMNNLPQNFYGVVGKNAAETSFFTKQGNGKKVYRYDLVTGITASGFQQPIVSVFPNPFTTKATISVSGEMKNYSFFVYDLLGNIISNSPITSPETEIEKDNLAPGIYIYELRDGSQVYATGKLIVQ
ncbi:hypothetical protein BH11BAC7_BH11BAC7_05400 [soil metagenome]